MTRPGRPDHAIELARKVAFHECDPLGVAWHGRYFEWLDIARTELFVSVQLEVQQIGELGHRLYVVETRCRYMAALRYADAFRVTAWFSAVRPLIRVAFDIHNEESGRWSARAVTSLATTDGEGQLLPTTPDRLLARLPAR